MREIKFRAWHKMWNLMATEIELGQQEADIIVGNTGDVLDINEEYSNLVFMQYTGLKDKNDKDIYEGDIVKGYWWQKGESHRHIGLVTYGMAAFKVVGVKQYLGMTDELNSVYEVIGNKFEDGDLLDPKS